MCSLRRRDLYGRRAPRLRTGPGAGARPVRDSTCAAAQATSGCDFHLAVPEKRCGLTLSLAFFDRCGNSGLPFSAPGGGRPQFHRRLAKSPRVRVPRESYAKQSSPPYGGLLCFGDPYGTPRLRAGLGAALTAHRAVIHSRAPRVPPGTRVIKKRRPTIGGASLFGDPYGTRTHVTAVKGRCLNLLTNGPNKRRSIFAAPFFW